MLYLRDIQNIMVHINSDPTQLTNGTILSNKIPKEWKLTESKMNSKSKVLEKDDSEKNKTFLLLHNRIFVQPPNDYYAGFNHYKSISPNYHVYLKGLYEYISVYFEDLELLIGDNST